MQETNHISIAIAGEAGSGKTSVAKRLGLELGWPVFGAGELFRAWCDAHGVKSYGATMGQDAQHDAIDQEMLELTRQGYVIVEGRVAGMVAALHEVPGVLKVLLVCEEEERYRRVYSDPSRHYASLQDAAADTVERERQNLVTFTARYNASYLDHQWYDLVIRNTHLTLDQTAREILTHL